MPWSCRKSRRETKASGPPKRVISSAWSWGTKLGDEKSADRSYRLFRKGVKGTHKLYSQILDSNVSRPVFCSEHATLDVSILLHCNGSWNPQVSFRNLGWKNPVKPVFVPLANEEFWSDLYRFSQYPLDSRYFSWSAVLFKRAAISEMQ